MSNEQKNPAAIKDWQDSIIQNVKEQRAKCVALGCTMIGNHFHHEAQKAEQENRHDPLLAQGRPPAPGLRVGRAGAAGPSVTIRSYADYPNVPDEALEFMARLSASGPFAKPRLQ